MTLKGTCGDCGLEGNDLLSENLVVEACKNMCLGSAKSIGLFAYPKHTFSDSQRA